MQQLAYLGEDGDVKHAKNGLLGTVRPMNLVYMDENGHARSANNGLFGAVAPTNLDEDHSSKHKRHHKKEDLQNLLWFDKDGAMHVDDKKIPKVTKNEVKHVKRQQPISVD